VDAAAITAKRVGPAIGRVDGARSREIVLIYARVILRADERTIDFIKIDPAMGNAGGVIANNNPTAKAKLAATLTTRATFEILAST